MHPVSTARSRPHQAQSAARTVIGTLVHKNNQFLLQGDDATPGLWPVSEYAEHLGGLNAGDRVMALLCEKSAGQTVSAVISSRLVSASDTTPALVDELENGTLRLNAPKGLILQAGNSRIELQPDGTLLIDGEDIRTLARHRYIVKGARVEFN
ncbi:MAG: hypothetical protein C0462_06375 [Alcanivorax sp.]|nr:hypothetical protein [Alcanivorax sp.]